MEVRPNNTPQGPLIPGYTTLKTYEVSLTNIDNLKSTVIKNDSVIWTSGQITGLIYPTSSTQIATKQYIDDVGGLNPQGPSTAVQFNGNNIFQGSENLTWTTRGLSVIGTIQSGSSIMSGSNISGITDPTLSSQVSTKNYADLSSLKNVNQLTGAGTLTYTASQIYNGIIIRVGLTLQTNTHLTTPDTDISVRNQDTFPTATDIFTYLDSINIGPYIGFTFSFNLYNISQNGSISLIIKAPDSSIIFSPYSSTNIETNLSSPIIYGSYQLSAQCMITGVDTPEITVIITRNSLVNNIEYTPGPGVYDSQNSIYNNISENGNAVCVQATTLRTNVQSLTPMNPIYFTDTSSRTYLYSDLSRRMIIRSGFVEQISDTIINSISFLSNSFFSNGSNTGLGFEFAIQNNSLFNLGLIPSTGWTFTQTISIPSIHTGLFNVIVDTELNTCTLFVIGMFDRS